MAFKKDASHLRKQWLSQLVPDTYVDHSKKTLPISDFINKELILFSQAGAATCYIPEDV